MFFLILMLKIISNHEKIEENAAVFLLPTLKSNFLIKIFSFRFCVCGNFCNMKGLFLLLFDSFKEPLKHCGKHFFVDTKRLVFPERLQDSHRLSEKKLCLFFFSVKFLDTFLLCEKLFSNCRRETAKITKKTFFRVI